MPKYENYAIIARSCISISWFLNSQRVGWTARKRDIKRHDFCYFFVNFTKKDEILEILQIRDFSLQVFPFSCFPDRRLTLLWINIMLKTPHQLSVSSFSACPRNAFSWRSGTAKSKKFPGASPQDPIWGIRTPPKPPVPYRRCWRIVAQCATRIDWCESASRGLAPYKHP